MEEKDRANILFGAGVFVEAFDGDFDELEFQTAKPLGNSQVFKLAAIYAENKEQILDETVSDGMRIARSIIGQ
jgi:hypothetical protein